MDIISGSLVTNDHVLPLDLWPEEESEMGELADQLLAIKENGTVINEDSYIRLYLESLRGNRGLVIDHEDIQELCAYNLPLKMDVTHSSWEA